MTIPALELHEVSKSFPFFRLDKVSFSLAQGQIMGFVGPNGAGKSTTVRLLMGLLLADAGEIRVLGSAIPEQQVRAKEDVAFITDGMALHGAATLAWHMDFVKRMVPRWDQACADRLLQRFYLRPDQPVKHLSTGERVKALLLLALARQPRLLVLDEPTTGLDPVARHEILAELSGVIADERRAVLFSSHNTRDIEQISDQITFIDRGRIVASSDKESYLENWRRLKLDIAEDVILPDTPGITDISRSGRIATVTVQNWSTAVQRVFEQCGATVHEIQRMSLEEIFVATVMHQRNLDGNGESIA